MYSNEDTIFKKRYMIDLLDDGSIIINDCIDYEFTILRGQKAMFFKRHIEKTMRRIDQVCSMYYHKGIGRDVYD